MTRTPRGSSIPNLAAFPLHGDAGGIADLDPDAARSGLIGAIDLLRHDALGTKLARMCEHGRPVLGYVFVKQDAGLETAQQLYQRSLAVKERATAQILAIMLDQVEGVEDCCPCRPPARQTPRTVTSRQARAQPLRRRS
jgi:hypothetical protein